MTALPTEFETLFEPLEGGTWVSLEHRGLENRGASAARIGAMLDGGWTGPLESVAAHVGDSPEAKGANPKA